MRYVRVAYALCSRGLCASDSGGFSCFIMRRNAVSVQVVQGGAAAAAVLPLQEYASRLLTC